ncbi:MAG: ABC transporter substrate-binding protein, partial [Acidobacteriota bacterium]
ESVVGMGPFRLKEYQRGIKVVLERNHHYWKKDRAAQPLPYLDSLVFLIIQDRNAEALRFQGGGLDLVNSLTAENYATVRRFQKQGGYQVQDLGPGLGMDFLWFNLNPGLKPSGDPFVAPEKLALFQKAEFRKAVSTALNREGINRSIMLGLGEPQYGPISTGNQAWLSRDLPRSPFQPERARSLLEGLGLRDRDRDGTYEFAGSGTPIEITIATARGNLAREKSAEVIRQNLAEAGLRVNLQLLLINELAARFLSTFDYEAILFGITPTDVVPDLQTDLWLSSGKLHFWYPAQSRPHYPWESEMDQMTLRLVRTLDPAERRQISYRIQELWAREMPAIPTLAPHILTGWKNSVGNVRPSILVPHLLWNAEELTIRSR